jgi:hypothetical protein
MTPEEKLAYLQSIVDEQAEDPGLWLVDMDNIVVAYLQQELRRLHRAIEEK